MDTLTLWYKQAASSGYDGWEKQALPIGNGFIGAKIFGGTAKEIIQFNEKSLWTGGPGNDKYTFGNGEGKNGRIVKELQSLLENGDDKGAAKAMSRLQGNENGFGSYQNFGNIELHFQDDAKGESYCRFLNLENAVSGVEFEINGKKCSREYFVSYPDNVFAGKLSTSVNGGLSFILSVKPAQECEIKAENGILNITGALPDNQLKFATAVKVLTNGGTVEFDEYRIIVKNADSAVILMSAATDYENIYPTYRSGTNPIEKAAETVEKAAEKGYDTLYERHIADYKKLFNSLSLDLFSEKNDKPTDALLAEYKKGKNSRLLETLYFQYGRYLMIASSRVNTLPANLQGIWNGKNNPPWQSDYHFNINLQMNYWISCVANLAETELPLIEYIEALVPAGRVTAKEYFGIEKGFNFNTQNNIFGNTGPGSCWKWGWSPALSAWIMHNLYEHYLFTNDDKLLCERIYPLLEELSDFWSLALIEDKKSGRLVSSPTFSPENGPVTAGNTFDQEIICQLFDDTLNAAENMVANGFGNKVNHNLITDISNKREKLKPLNIGKWGQIKEWFEEDEWKNRGFSSKGVEKNHRHISQLLGLYPFNHINEETPDLLNAAAVSLVDRDNFKTLFRKLNPYLDTGWSKAWKTACWARLFDGETAYSTFNRLLSKSVHDNLWDFHPPFQIDGNFGGTAAVCEMLIQSHCGFVRFLPALPSCWKDGKVSGIMARNAFECDIEWRDMKIINASVKSLKGNSCLIARDNFDIKEITDSKGNKVDFTVLGSKLRFETKKNEKYYLV